MPPRAWLQVKRIMHYQLPPRGFWFWWCDGLQVYDALVVAAWLAVNILYVQQRTALVLSYYRSPGLYRGACGSLGHATHATSAKGTLPGMA